MWRFNTVTGVWTQVSPIPSSSADDCFGYSGLTVDRKRPGTLVVATQVSWWPDVMFFRSTDSGATWSRIWDWNGYPNRTKRYSMDTSGAPWLNWGGAGTAPEDQPKLGWMTESVEVDPFDSNKLMYGTGATSYGTDNLTAWDTGGTVNISVRAQGLEETAVNDLVSPPAGAPLVSALGDIGGFRHDSLTTVPARMHISPTIGSTTSVNGATSFTAAATGVPATGNVRFGAVPGIAGDVWLAGGADTGAYGLWHSTNGGTSFTKLSTVAEADSIGFGKAAPGKTYPALYSSAAIGGVRGIFRSDASGATWTRINDDQHQWGWTGAAITGDPRVYGRVYVSTNGRGIIYGDDGGGPTDPDPDPDPDPVGNCSVAYEVTGQWQGGFQGRAVVTNTGNTPLDGWSLGWSFGAGQVVSQMWGAAHSQSGASVTAVGASWNAVIAPGTGREVGFIASWQGSNPEPTAFTLNGSGCSVG
ncbi:cellulose-binding domain-containing protein [Phytomonospora sp. NPDC050363]|uniref:cellulose-binding domain-containing protein n=1 Tax=Phytomonospora sp. NPDC050363 TaxID=3155642 RepID=UPI003406A1BB